MALNLGGPGHLCLAPRPRAVSSVNVDGGVTFAPTVNAADPSVLYFTGDRPGQALGKYDIYRIRFRVRS